MARHDEVVVDQFTRQAVPYSQAPAIRDEEALHRLVEFSGATPDDTLLDVACGPGVVVCAFAAVARHATGIDLTPAMIACKKVRFEIRGELGSIPRVSAV